MKLHTLKPSKRARKQSKRLGRGQGSGKGGTCTRGHKGAKSRSGNSKKIGFEGGQMPLQRRIPKFGFKNINRVEYCIINLDTLQYLIDNKKISDTVNKEILVNNNLASKNDKIKILGRGKIDVPLNITVDKFTKSAIKIITDLGGSAVEL